MLPVVVSADAVIAVTPIFASSYSGLFKSFIDVLDPDALRGTPVLLGATALLAMSATPVWSAESLTVWWVKGFYRSEDEALFKAIKAFEEKTGVKVELSQYCLL